MIAAQRQKGLAVPRDSFRPPARMRVVAAASCTRKQQGTLGCVPHIHRVYPGPYIARVVPMAWPSRFLMRDPPVSGTSAETTSVGRSRPESSQTMLKQAALITFASSAAMALQPSILQTLQRGLHTRLAASSRRRTKFTRLAVYTRLRRPMNPPRRSSVAPSSAAPSRPSSRPSRPPPRAPPTPSTTRPSRPTSRRSSRATRTRARPF